MKYRIAPAAEQDIADLWEYIAGDHPPAADRVIEAIKQQFQQIAHQPEIGRSRHELAPDLRSQVVFRYRRYVIFYQRRDEWVEIVRVLDGARNLRRMFDQKDD